MNCKSRELSIWKFESNWPSIFHRGFILNACYETAESLSAEFELDDAVLGNLGLICNKTYEHYDRKAAITDQSPYNDITISL